VAAPASVIYTLIWTAIILVIFIRCPTCNIGGGVTLTRTPVAVRNGH
jgi:hypothetical protein